ncbi:hypothetical protein TrCOL_g11191 [Triparma columacea]|uniref:Uncharacterized protein n=1 Tax=Triparma columacea TaxID=722753 RepID=A0A9W7LDW7_9STRA|nr:hypothetical protein TrCOL_g11191 [Triparma columacea]
MRHKVIVIEGRRRVGRRLNKAHLKHPPINKIEPIDINDDEDTEEFTSSNRKTTSHVELPHISTTFKSCRMPATGFPARDLGRRRMGGCSFTASPTTHFLPAGPNGD